MSNTLLDATRIQTMYQPVNVPMYEDTNHGCIKDHGYIQECEHNKVKDKIMSHLYKDEMHDEMVNIDI
jgi:hypothetical protein